MFSTLKTRLLLGVYVFILLSIPAGAFLASENQTTKSKANETVTKPIVKVTPKPATSPAKELLSASQSNSSTSPTDDSPTIANNFGPTLSLKTALEGRPQANQSTKLFVGIMEGNISSNPKFLLSFSVDLPESGEYSNLSLAGLTSGSSYTAILKGVSQIATASAFVMSPTVTNLNSGGVVNMLSGDLNEDNVINNVDYSIAKAALNSTSTSSTWNANADLNSDGVVNLFDLIIISRNNGQVGATGAWTSPIPKVATSSAAIGGSGESTNGHWIWIP